MNIHSNRHMAASAALLATYDNKVLIGRKASGYNEGKHCLIGGWFCRTKDKTLEDTIKREAMEEVKLQLDTYKLTPFSFFTGTRDNESAKTSFSVVQVAYFYPLYSEELIHILATKSDEICDLELCNFKDFKQKDMAYEDQVYFLQKLFTQQISF